MKNETFTPERIKAEADAFFEWDGEDRSLVTTTSCLLFAQHIAGLMQARSAQPAPVVPEGSIYVECRQCDKCQHVGINDAAHGLAACHDCDWSGNEPEDDKCPGCKSENCMAAACPECGARYALIASEDVAAAPAQVLSSKDDPRKPHELSAAGCRCVRFGEGNPHWPCPIHAEPAQGQQVETTARCFCGGPYSKNPHEDAGKPTRVLEVGAVYECIPCLTKSRHEWSKRATATESELSALKAQQSKPSTVTRDQIRDVFMRNGFTVKENQTDLKPYVYAAAEELLSIARASQQCTQSSWVPDGWQLVPKEPTAEMIEALAASFWPADWEAGKRLQRLRGTKVVFPKTEIEMAVGKYERVLSAALAAHDKQSGEKKS